MESEALSQSREKMALETSGVQSTVHGAIHCRQKALRKLLATALEIEGCCTLTTYCASQGARERWVPSGALLS